MTTTTATALATQVYQVFIKATPEAIWDAIIKPEFTHKYFHGGARRRRRARPARRCACTRPTASRCGATSSIQESDPPRRLVVGWRSLYDEELAAEERSRVTWEIEPREDGVCLLTVVHDQLERSPKTASSVSGEGWMHVLSGLKTLLETGQPMRG